MSSDPASTPADQLKRTPLYDAHVALGAKMVPFAGYAMPVQYAEGVMKEHLATRTAAGLFDVSHMGQCVLRPRDGRFETVAAGLEHLVPADVLGLAPGRQCYTQLVDDSGGILDDLMIARPADPAHANTLALVVNAACKDQDFAHIAARLPQGVDLKASARALLALQGPQSENALERVLPGVSCLAFMSTGSFNSGTIECHVTRSGYTGEDGFEISVATERAVALWHALLTDTRVKPIGLGARDSLRLEAGLCLYGADIDRTTTPVEAGLAWSIPKVRRNGGARVGGFPGAARILDEIERGPTRRRVGLKPEGRAPVRAGAPLFTEPAGGAPVGAVTSGGFAPSLNAPISMGYVPANLANPGARVFAEVRGQRLPLAVSPLPFVPHRYKRPAKANA